MGTDPDLTWLLSRKPPQDQLRMVPEKVRPLIRLIEEQPISQLPMTIGVFGTWGCGKTSMLAYAAEHLLSDQNSTYQIVYFNAWKYAGFMEIMPALIFKILKSKAAVSTGDMKTIARIMMSLGSKYSSALRNWTKSLTGLDLVNIASYVSDIATTIRRAQDPWGIAVQEYYTQVDRAQDLLSDFFQNTNSKTVVFVDELDRCAPDEAFDIIKQLRVFFAMRNIPVVFVLAANPDPIGQAIRHQFGLESARGDYEALRILEKFVDLYVDMASDARLERYITAAFGGNEHWQEKHTLVGLIDKRVHAPRYEYDTILNSKISDVIRLDNPFYANLRLVRKCALSVKGWSERDPDHFFPLWHLEILQQSNAPLRQRVRQVADQLRQIAEWAHIALLQDLACYGVDRSSGEVQGKVQFQGEGGTTAFARYRTFFYKHTEKIIHDSASHRPKDIRARQILTDFIEDYQLMDFIIMMSLVGFSGRYPQFKVDALRDSRFQAPQDFVENWDSATPFGSRRFGWLLANYGG